MSISAIANGLSQLMARFSRSASYTPPTGSAITGVSVRINSVQSSNDVNHGNRTDLRMADVRVLQSEISLPEVGGYFTVGDDVWRITERPILRNGQWVCKVEAGILRRMNAPGGGVTSQ